MTTHRATAYLVLRATRDRYGHTDPETGLKPVDQVRATMIRQSRPSALERDEVAVKVTVEIPDDAFAPLAPAALIVVPTDLALRGPIGVEATDANPEEE